MGGSAEPVKIRDHQPLAISAASEAPQRPQAVAAVPGRRDGYAVGDARFLPPRPCRRRLRSARTAVTLEVTIAGWATLIGAIGMLFALDLVRLAARPCPTPSASAARASVLYIAVAVAFGVVFGLIAVWDFGSRYFASYIVEKRLSVDNPIRLRDHHGDDRRAGGAPAADAHLRHPRDARVADDLHRRWCGAAFAVLVHVRRLRRSALRHRDPALPPRST
jgi:hypothetical protein